MKAEEIDQKFDAGEDITGYMDMSLAEKPGLAIKRVNVDFPLWMILSMDKESKRLGITRQSIIKIWISEKLKELAR
jgi:hypothetical protein